MNELISIVVPVYNVEKYLNDCIHSILVQTYPYFELILVDDGSTDSSGEICDKYAQADSRIKVIHKENGGLSDARNMGIAKVTGEYLFLVDSDDFITENALELLITTAKQYNADLVVGGYQYVDEKGQLIKIINVLDNVLLGEQVSDYFFFNKGDGIQNVTAWGKLYNLSLHREILVYPKGKLHEDEFVAHKIWLNSKSAVILSCPIYNYRTRSDSIMGSKFTINRLDCIQAVIERLDYVKYNQNYIPAAWDMCMFLLADRTVSVYSRRNIGNPELRKKLAEYRKILKEKWREISPCINNTSSYEEKNMPLFHPRRYAAKKLFYSYYERGCNKMIRTLKRIFRYV